LGTPKKSLVERVGDAVAGAAATLVGSGDDAAAAGDAKVERAAAFAARAEDHLERAQSDDALSDYGRAHASRVASFKAMPQDGPYGLRFADGETFFDGVIMVDRTDIKDRELGATYEKPVEFPPEGELAVITEAWLIDRGGDAVRCVLGPPALPTGAGHAALIPAGNLLF
jgi:hypothetical protein